MPLRIDGATTDAQAFDFLSRNRYDVVSIGGGVEAASRNRLRDVLIAAMPDIQVIEVPRPDSESIAVLGRKPIQMNGPDELAEILSGILERRQQKQLKDSPRHASRQSESESIRANMARELRI